MSSDHREYAYSQSTNTNALRLGLQLGIIKALTSENKRLASKKTSSTVARTKLSTNYGEDSTCTRIREHRAKMQEVNRNLKEINSRFSVFDAYLMSNTMRSESCDVERNSTSSSIVATAENGRSFVKKASFARKSQRFESPSHARHYLVEENVIVINDDRPCLSTITMASPAKSNERSVELRLSSPLRSRHQPLLYSEPYVGPKDVHQKVEYRIRIDFWSEQELQRMRAYAQNPMRYGIEPSYIVLIVSEYATPHDVLNSILHHWEWDDLHNFRFTGASAGSDGLNGKCYEGQASRVDPLAPSMREFGLYTGAQCLLTYDLQGDSWQWVCTVCGVQPMKAAQLPRKVGLLDQSGALPAQYLWQFEERLERDVWNISEEARVAPETIDFTDITEAKRIAERVCRGRLSPESGLIEKESHADRTHAKVVEIFRSRYVDRCPMDIERLHQKRLDEVRKGLFF